MNVLTELFNNKRVQNRFEFDKNRGLDSFLESVMSIFLYTFF
jgi:hypothetical protein